MLTRNRHILLNAYHILNDGLFDAVPVLLTFIVLAMGSGEKEMGLIISLGTAVSTAAGLGTIFLSRCFGPMRTIALLIGISGACFCLTAFAQHMLLVGFCFTAAVAGYYAFHNISFSYLAAHTERSQFGRTLSDFTAIGDIGRIPFVAFAAFASAYSYAGFPGWRLVCLGYGTTALAAAIWLLLSTPDEKNESPPAAKKSLPSFGLLREKKVFLPVLASLLNAFSNDKIFAFLPLLMLAKGFDPTIIGSFALGFTVGSFLGKMACGRLVDKFGPRSVFITAEAALAVLLFLLIALNNIVVIICISLLIGVLTKGTVPVIQAIITEPVRHLGAYNDIFSIDSFLRGIVNVITPLLFGFIASAWNINAIYMIMAAVAVMAIIPVVLCESAYCIKNEENIEQDGNQCE